MDHVHRAAEPEGARPVGWHVHDRVGEGGQEPVDSEVTEHHPGAAVPVLAPVEHQPQGRAGAGVDQVRLVAAQHDHRCLLAVITESGDRGLLGPEEVAGQGGDQDDAADGDDERNDGH